MRVLIVVCLGMMAGGIYVLLKHPDAAVVGLPLTAIPVLILAQTLMLAFARLLRPTMKQQEESPHRQPAVHDFFGVFHAYCDFKLFLARMVGFVAIAFGVVTFNGYYLAFGTASVILFWIWDRKIATAQEDHSQSDEPTNPTVENRP